MRRLSAVLAAGLLVAGLLVAGCGGQPGGADPTATPDQDAGPTATVLTEARSVVTADGAFVLPVPPQTLSFPAGATVLEVAVAPGDAVTKGDLLARIDLLALDRAVSEAEAVAAAARNDLERLREGTPGEASSARADVQRAEEVARRLEARDDIRRIETELDRARNSRWAAQAERDSVCGLAAEGLARQSACDSAQANVQGAEDAVRIAEQAVASSEAAWPGDVAAARSALQAARARLAQAARGPSASAIESAEARVEQAERALQHASAERERAILVAPFDGEVDQVHVAEGAPVGPGAPAITLVQTSPLYFATSNLGERNVGAVVPGAEALITLTAFPDSPLPAVVDRIAPRAQEAATGGTVYTVYLAVEEGHGLALRAGMTGRVEIEVGDR